ncbi:MAG: hypothetical protein ABFC90_00355 [Bacteroidales bacterium]|nr:hypothetical protein [Bacteroidales bacterium]MCK9311583.1 hypothetical protein [Bacteroidales bacterium]
MKKFNEQIIFFILCLLLAIIVIGMVTPYNKDGYNRAFFVKDSTLINRTEPAIILVGGSNVAFGFDSKEIEDSLGVKVINSGLHAGLGLNFIIDNIADRVRKGDVVVLCPEYTHFFGITAFGGQPLADLFYISPKYIYKYINNYDQIKCILTNTPAFLKSKLEYMLVFAILPEYETIYRKSAFNQYGDVTAHWNKGNKSYAQFENFGEGGINYKVIYHYINKINEMKSKGVNVLFFPPALSETTFKNTKGDIMRIDSIFQKYNIKTFIPAKNYVFNDSLFFDTPFHLTYQGAVLHTQLLIGDLKKILSSK